MGNTSRLPNDIASPTSALRGETPPRYTRSVDRTRAASPVQALSGCVRHCVRVLRPNDRTDGVLLPAHRLQAAGDVLCGGQGGPHRLRGVRKRLNHVCAALCGTFASNALLCTARLLLTLCKGMCGVVFLGSALMVHLRKRCIIREHLEKLQAMSNV